MTTRVLMTADTVGGVWTYALELVDALAHHDVEVHLATMGRGLRPEQATAAKQSTVVEVHERDFALEWQDDPWDDVDRAGEWLLDLEATVRPDVVHLNGYVHAVLPWRAPVLVVGHSDVLSWWEAVHGEPAPGTWDTYRRRVAAGLAAADAVVAPTAAMLAALQRHYDCRGGQVISNCRRSDWVRYARKEPLIVGAGRAWDQAKNLALLDEVSPALPWPVVVAGDQRHPDTGEVAPRSPGTTRFVGDLPFDDLAARLLRASIFVLPAKYEPFGLGALEAAQAGCALVLGDIPSLREVWGDAALYVNPRRADRLENVLLHLIENPVELHEMGTRARNRARLYCPERTAQGYLHAYRTLPVRAGGAR